MEIREIILCLLDIELAQLNKVINKLFAELQAKYDNDIGWVESCEDYIKVLQMCKDISSKADTLQMLSDAEKIYDKFLQDTGIDLRKDN